MTDLRRVTVVCLLTVSALANWGAPPRVLDSVHAAQLRRPIAVAGLNQVIAGIGIPVHLDGSASSDPAGLPLNYQWTIIEAPFGSSASLVGGATVSPTFVPDVKGGYRVQLVVDNGTATSRPDVVAITVRNTPPVAEAGNQLFAAVGDTVQLDGSASSDADGDALTFQWGFLSVPRGSRPRLSDATAVRPTFLVDRPGRYVVRLVVRDAQTRAADTVVVDVANTPPQASAGADRTAAIGERIRLDGSGSFDVDGDRLSYAWLLLSVPPGSAATLGNPNAVRPRFTVDLPGRYVAQLTVNDGLVASEPDTVVISTGNSAPVANAGPDQSALVGQTVHVNGSASSDIDGDELTFEWAFVAIPAGSTAVLGDATSANPSFTVDRRGSYELRLIVHDGLVPSGPDFVVITVGNSVPVANAGSDRRVAVGDTVTLDGSASADVDGDPLTYHWSLIDVPPGSAASLSDPNAVTPAFDVDLPGTYVAQLLVNDGVALSAADTVTIATDNVAPVANAGPDQSAYVGQLVQLNGGDSVDPDGDSVTFSWSFVSRPAGSAATLTGATTIGPAFTVDVPGDYIVQLIVSDGELPSGPDTVTVTTRANTLPIANAGPDQTDVPVGGAIVLDGSASSDADGHPLSYRWSLLSRPDGSAAVLSDPTALFPSFIADVAGDYVAQLVVNDGLSDSLPATAMIRTARPPVVADAGDDQTVAVGAVVQLDGSGSSDPSGEAITYQWSFVSVPPGSLAVPSSPTAVNPTFIADVAGSYVIALTVTNESGATASDSVTVTAVASTPTVTVAATDPSAAEAGSDPGTFIVTRFGSTSGTLSVAFMLTGTAVNGTDYESIPLVAAIADGETSASVQIHPIEDLEVEGDETIVLTLQPGSYIVGPSNSATIVITDGTLGPGTLINGANHSGSIPTAGEIDLWTFAANAGDTISLSLGEVGLNTEFVPWIRLRAPDGTQIEGSFGNVVAQVNATAPATGTYTVLVGSFDSGLDGTGTYLLTLAHTPAAFVVPVGDEGGPLTNGANHAGTIHVGDLDQWTFAANSGDTISLSLGEVGPNAEFVPWIRLRGPNGTQIEGSFGNVVAQINATAPATGTYTVVLGTFDSGLDATGNYLLTLAHTPAAIVVPTGDEGGALTNGANHAGTIHVGDLDQWTFVANAGDAISLSLGEVGPNAELVPWIRLRGPNGTQVEGSFGNVVAQVNTTAPTSGVYTVLIGTFDSGLDATGNYRLTLAHTPGTFVVPMGDEGGALTNGGNHAATIHVGDLDQWTFVANAGDTISLSLAEVGLNAEFVPWIRLRAPNGTQVEGSFGNVVAQVNATASTSGVYTVVIGTFDSGLDATGNYLLTLAHTPAAFAVPTGDEGGALTNGANHAGTIHIGDLDQWTFVASAGDTISLSLGEVGLNAEFVPWIRLRAPNGTQVDGSFGNVVAQINATATSTGTYTVIVGTFDSGLDATGDYLLTLAHTPDSIVVPPGDEGGAVTNGANHTGAIHVGDLDQWSFTANQGDTISVSLGEVGSNSAFVPWIRLRAPNGTQIDGSFGNVVAQINATAASTGTYTVVVGTFDSGLDATGDYRLTLARTPGSFVVPAGDEGGALASGGNAGAIHVGDLDLWTFSATQGTAISLSLAEVGSNPEFVPWIRLRAPNGTQISGSFGNSVALVNINAPATGTYTVVVGTFDSGLDGTGDYVLTRTP